MHILFVAREFFPTGGDTATYLGHMVRMLGRAGHRVTIVVPGRVERKEWLAEGVQVVRVNLNSRSVIHSLRRTLSRGPALSYGLADAVIDHMRSESVRPDVIEVEECDALGYYLLQRRLVDKTPLREIPILLHLHALPAEILGATAARHYRFPDYWVGRMERFCMNAADALLSASRFLRNQMVQQRVMDASMEVIPFPAVDPLPSSASTQPPSVLEWGDLVCVGALEIGKELLSMLEACARLWADGKVFRLTLLGADASHAEADGTARKLVRQKYQGFIECGRLVLAEGLPSARIRRRVQSAWVVLMPSLGDNYPYACIEAMRAGKVIVASGPGGKSEMIGTEGWLFHWEEEGSFEEAITAALSMTAREHEQMGERARQRVTSLTSYDVILPQRLAHYELTAERAAAKRSSRTFPSVNWDLLPSAGPRARDLKATRGLLSAVIPFYNLGDYVEETVASVLSSTYRPMEIMIVDDGSDEEKSLAVLERIGRGSGDGLRIIRTAKKGLAEARNLGAECANGEYLAFIDADDKVEPEFFERAVGVLDSFDNVGFAYSWVQFFGQNQGWWPTWNTEFPYLLGQNMLVPIVVVKRELFLRYARNRPELVWGYEDWDSWIRLAAAGYKGVSLPHRLVRYRIRGGSMFRRLTLAQSLALYDLIARASPEAYGRHAIELLNLVSANGPHYLWIHPATQSRSPHFASLRTLFLGWASKPGLRWMQRLEGPLRSLALRLHV